MNKAEKLKQAIEKYRRSYRRGAIYKIPSKLSVDDQMERVEEIIDEHVVNAKLYRDPYMNFDQGANRLTQISNPADELRKYKKRQIRDRIRREVETYCRMALFLDERNVGPLPVE